MVPHEDSTGGESSGAHSPLSEVLDAGEHTDTQGSGPVVQGVAAGSNPPAAYSRCAPKKVRGFFSLVDVFIGHFCESSGTMTFKRGRVVGDV